MLLDADAPVAASALGTLGELAEVAGEAVRPAIPSLLPLLLPLLQDSGSAQKRHAALRALSQLSLHLQPLSELADGVLAVLALLLFFAVPGGRMGGGRLRDPANSPTPNG